MGSRKSWTFFSHQALQINTDGQLQMESIATLRIVNEYGHFLSLSLVKPMGSTRSRDPKRICGLDAPDHRKGGPPRMYIGARGMG
ncbi:unnamed protein product [Nippostrongylus brasiliensis]|uniref:30S ribosomal protein S11 n=1 Tax=Nippostrongylus brasiliensis TaxID=27835 RepID=A0A0N4Y1T1_NIPBR|nr:unnamed protein product [Nippostrongylus brasiliensis]